MKAILLFALSAIILSQSYGVAHAVHVSSHLGLDLEIEPPITVATDSSSYEEGEMINVSGSVSDYIESDPFKNFDVTLRLIAPNNNIITISQIPLNSDGSYSTFIPAQGPLWKFDGDYTISVSWGSDTNASTTFTFILGSEEEVIEEEVIEGEAIEVMLEEELAEGCGEGTHLEDGICVLDETTVEPAFVSTGSVPTVGSTSLFYSITFTVLIAFAIMIVLYLISRGSRTKTA
ncbi:hypothetical protein HX849_08405 [Marine Group I thaumarchaeote]|nr:hypothetical protein [Marine Group I thaumarchaeote]